MSAIVTDMADFICALEREAPRGLHPCADSALNELFAEMHAVREQPAAVRRLTRNVCSRVVSELTYSAENAATFGDHREAYRARRQAARFARRYREPLPC